MQGFLKSVIYAVHHPVHVCNILVSAIFFFFTALLGAPLVIYNINL